MILNALRQRLPWRRHHDIGEAQDVEVKETVKRSAEVRDETYRLVRVTYEAMQQRLEGS